MITSGLMCRKSNSRPFAGGLNDMVIGGQLKSIGSNARLGSGEFIVAEADESDGSFLKMSPRIAVVTNTER